jgi:transposase
MNTKQKQFLLENYGKASTASIAVYLGCSTTTVIRWARKLGLDIRAANCIWKPTPEQSEYICINYGKVPCRFIADVLGVSVSSVRSFAKRIGLRITKEQLADLKTFGLTFRLNPNPVTDTTKMLVCRYYYEGDSFDFIAYQLGRPKELVISLLRECINDGTYRNYNLFGHLIKSGTERSATRRDA